MALLAVLGAILFSIGVISASRDPARYGPPLGSWSLIILGIAALAVAFIWR